MNSTLYLHLNMDHLRKPIKFVDKNIQFDQEYYMIFNKVVKSSTKPKDQLETYRKVCEEFPFTLVSDGRSVHLKYKVIEITSNEEGDIFQIGKPFLLSALKEFINILKYYGYEDVSRHIKITASDRINTYQLYSVRDTI